MNTNCEFFGNGLDITCALLYSSESCPDFEHYYHEDGNSQTLILPIVEENTLYNIDSGIGGVFTLKYKSIKDGKYFFKNTAKEWNLLFSVLNHTLNPFCAEL